MHNYKTTLTSLNFYTPFQRLLFASISPPKKPQNLPKTLNKKASAGRLLNTDSTGANGRINNIMTSYHFYIYFIRGMCLRLLWNQDVLQGSSSYPQFVSYPHQGGKAIEDQLGRNSYHFTGCSLFAYVLPSL